MKKRFERLRLRPLAIAFSLVFLAVSGHALLIVRYIQGQDFHDSVIADVEDVELTMGRFKHIDELTSELNASKSQLEKARSAIPASQSNTFAIDSLLRLAEASDLKVVDIKSESGDNVNAGEHTYGLILIRLNVEGTLENLMVFLEDIESGDVKATRVEDLSITELLHERVDSLETPSDAISPYASIFLAVNLRISVLTRI